LQGLPGLPVPLMIFVENETASQLYLMSKINKVPSKNSSHRGFFVQMPPTADLFFTIQQVNNSEKK